jgi:2',3'-cyclic-nucleotide 2'-phosphodiesterase (5'-nucleotidase family)
MKDRKSPFLVANLFSENGEPASTFLPNTENSHLFEMENGVKIGVIGLVTKLTPQTTMGFVDHSFPQY